MEMICRLFHLINNMANMRAMS